MTTNESARGHEDGEERRPQKGQDARETGADRRRPKAKDAPAQPAGERGGPKGPEPTRFGDWEKNGRCFDF